MNAAPITTPIIWERECEKLMHHNKQLQDMLQVCWKQLDAAYRATSELQAHNQQLMGDLDRYGDLYQQIRDERDELAARCRSMEMEIMDLRQRNNALDSQFRFSSSQYNGFSSTQKDE